MATARNQSKGFDWRCCHWGDGGDDCVTDVVAAAADAVIVRWAESEGHVGRDGGVAGGGGEGRCWAGRQLGVGSERSGSQGEDAVGLLAEALINSGMTEKQAKDIQKKLNSPYKGPKQRTVDVEVERDLFSLAAPEKILNISKYLSACLG